MHSRVGWMFCGRVMAGNPRLMFFKNARLSLIIFQKQEVLTSAYSFPSNGSHSAHNRLTSSLHDHTLELAFFFFFFHPDWCICMLLGGFFFSPCRLDRFLSVPRPHSFPTSSLFTQEHDCLRTTFIECIIWLYPSNICILSAGGLHTRYNMCIKDPVESIFPQILLFVFEFIRNSLLAFRLIRERVACCFHLNWLSFRNCSLIWV